MWRGSRCAGSEAAGRNRVSRHFARSTFAALATDLGFTLFCFAALLAVRRTFRTLGPGIAVAAGVAIGACFASKHSALLLVPTIFAFALLRLFELGNARTQSAQLSEQQTGHRCDVDESQSRREALHLGLAGVGRGFPMKSGRSPGKTFRKVFALR